MGRDAGCLAADEFKSGGGKAFFGVSQDGDGLFPGYSIEPVQKIVDGGAFFHILKKSFYGNARAFEDPGAAHAFGIAFDHIA
jgi:hypothetical protein